MAKFYIYSFDFVLIQVHIKPTDAQEEIKHLRDVVEYARSYYGDSDIFIIGDLNADCSYYKPGLYLNDYHWVIPDSADTTTSKTHCAYDRIITIEDYSHMIKRSGVDNYGDDGITDLDLIKAISDHYPIYMELEI
jgi:deoxyribonuclease-1/deoxyribonuclease-1-like protein